MVEAGGFKACGKSGQKGESQAAGTLILSGSVIARQLVETKNEASGM